MIARHMIVFIDQMIATLKDRDDWQVIGTRMHALAAQLLDACAAHSSSAAEIVPTDEANLWRRIEGFCEPFRGILGDPSEAISEELFRERMLRAVVVFWVGLRGVPLEEAARILPSDVVEVWDSLLREVSPVDIDVARKRHFTVPQRTSDALSLIRSGQLAPGSTPQRVPRSVSQTFVVPPKWPDMGFWRLLPPRGVELMLPFDGDVVITKLGGSLRSVLSGGVMRLWLATWVLAQEQGDPQGVFQINPRHVICNLYGRELGLFKGANGKQYGRASPTLVSDLWKHLDVLRAIHISEGGKVRPETPQALILKYTRQDTGEEVYQHAPLTIQLAKRAFTQVPRAVLQLHPNDASTALGIANLWRMRITSVIRGSGAYERDLETLAVEIGEDTQAGPRRDGKAWWMDFAARLARVMSTGELGTSQIEGIDPNSRVRLTPSEALTTVYLPLCEATDRKRDMSQRADLEAEVRTRLPPRRGPGRPRKSGK